MTDLPVRSVGFIEARLGVTPITDFILEYDGYWVRLTGGASATRTIGSVSSGATIAQLWTLNLFTAIWTLFPQSADKNLSICPVQTSSGGSSTRGASAAADYAANKRIVMPDFMGRVLSGADVSTPETNQSRLGGLFGQTERSLTLTQMPAHNHRLNALGTPGSNFRNVNVSTAGSVDQYVDSSGGAPYVETAGVGNPFSLEQPSHVTHFWISAGSR